MLLFLVPNEGRAVVALPFGDNLLPEKRSAGCTQ